MSRCVVGYQNASVVVVDKYTKLVSVIKEIHIEFRCSRNEGGEGGTGPVYLVIATRGSVDNMAAIHAHCSSGIEGSISPHQQGEHGEQRHLEEGRLHRNDFSRHFSQRLECDDCPCLLISICSGRSWPGMPIEGIGNGFSSETTALSLTELTMRIDTYIEVYRRNTLQKERWRRTFSSFSPLAG